MWLHILTAGSKQVLKAYIAEWLESVVQKPILRLGVRNRFVQHAKAPARRPIRQTRQAIQRCLTRPLIHLLHPPWGDVQRSPTSTTSRARRSEAPFGLQDWLLQGPGPSNRLDKPPMASSVLGLG